MHLTPTYDSALPQIDAAMLFARRAGAPWRAVLRLPDDTLTGAQGDSAADLLAQARALGAVRLYEERAEGTATYDPRWRGVAVRP